MAAMARQMDSDPDKKMLAQIEHKIGELQRKVDEARREASGGPRRLTAAKSKSRRRRPSPPTSSSERSLLRHEIDNAPPRPRARSAARTR